MRRGFTVVELLVGVALLALGALLSLPRLFEQRKHGNEAAAIGALKTLCTAQAAFRESRRSHVGFLYSDLQGLADAGLIDARLGGGLRQGYLFAAAPSTTTPEFLWWATADPVAPGHTGDRWFCTNQAGVIYYTCGPGGGPVRLPRDTCVVPYPDGPLPSGR